MALRLVTVATVLSALALASPAAAAWTPGPAVYGVTMQGDVPVTMSDGAVLRADVWYPTDKATGKPADGPFPVLLVQTPYGKRSTTFATPVVPSVSAGILNASGADPYLISRGYITVVADVRGTGGSGGTWGLFDPQQADDGATLVHWAAGVPHSDGHVGTYGASYLGIDQFLTASKLERGSPLRAMFPVVVASELYRDTAFPGGMPGAEFALLYLGLTGSLNLVNPAVTRPNPSDLALTELQHIAGTLDFHLPFASVAVLGGDATYDEQYWRVRSPVTDGLAATVRNGIPTMMLGGWHDLFGRGTPLDYSGLQNLAAGRPVGAPMSPDQPVDPRFQLMMGPWYHVTAGKGVDLQALELRWFDRWLKGDRNRVDDTRTPIRAYVLGPGRWVDAAHYPFAKAVPTTWYLESRGRLASAPPTAKAGSDPILWTGLTSPCNGSAETWSAGFFSAIVSGTSSNPDPTVNPCAKDDRQRQLGPGALTYTTAPMSKPVLLAGPIGATVYMTSTRAETELVATIEDVAPDGTSTPLNNGALLGSHRALDRERSWFAPGGLPLLPYHPYTRAAQRPVPVGAVTRYDLEIFPTLAQLDAGHRLRLTLNTGDTPRIVPTVDQNAALLGGVYAVQRTADAPSSLTVPVASPDALDTPGTLRACTGRRRFTITVRVPRRAGRITSATVTYRGRRARVRLSRRTARAVIDLRGSKRATVRVRIVAHTSRGRAYRSTRVFHPCKRR